MAVEHLSLEDTGLTSLPAGGFEGLFFSGTSPHSDPNIELSNNPLQVGHAECQQLQSRGITNWKSKMGNDQYSKIKESANIWRENV